MKVSNINVLQTEKNEIYLPVDSSLIRNVSDVIGECITL